MLTLHTRRAAAVISTFALLALLAFGIWRSLDPYPTSDVIINPTTGAYDPALAAWVLPITSTNAEKSWVGIDMGNRAGASPPEQDCLFLLSPVLRLNPHAREFMVSWTQRAGFSVYDGGQELNYHRDTGEVYYRSRGYMAGKSYREKKLVATGVRDIDIHRLAAKSRPYTDLAK